MLDGDLNDLRIGVPDEQLLDKMHIPKRYGESKKQDCPFCGKKSITENSQGVPVCLAHKSSSLDLKCICGDWLETKKGKWGPYFTCPRCGNLSFAKAMEANPGFGKKTEKQESSSKTNSSKQISVKPLYKAEKQSKKEMIITSDELDFY